MKKKKIFKVTFPFRGRVKTQLKIVTSKDGSKRLIKPKDVKQFENAMRTILSVAFPIEERPVEGYIKFEMFHYTQYKRTKDGLIVSSRSSIDLDNVLKLTQDCFQPVFVNIVKLDEEGNPIMTAKGKTSYTKQEVTPGVIKDDKYVMRAGLHWIPVETKEEERIEVYISTLSEKELFHPQLPKGEIVDLGPY
jgi:Holliday junction resolvase RusA-like endonuclease